jgi:RNA recognition motif-containing protein
MRIFIANLPYHLTEAALKRLFRIFGVVENARLIKEEGTGKSKGFGFVTMRDKEAAQLAIRQLDGCLIRDREINVKEAEDYPVASNLIPTKAKRQV